MGTLRTQSDSSRTGEPRRALQKARVTLGLTLQDAAAAGPTPGQIKGYERGEGRSDNRASVRQSLFKLCRYYMKLAEERGYDPAPYHESLLCPGEFPPPATKQTEQLDVPVEAGAR